MTLVIGASGYVGRRFMEVHGASGPIGTFNSSPVPGCVRFNARTTRLAEAIPNLSDIKHAVIFYAEAGIDECKADLERSYDINVKSTKQVIDDLVEMEIKPIFTSSEYVFNGERGGYTEEDLAAPNTVYGSQKFEVEQYLASLNIDYAVLRLAKVFGTDPTDGTILSALIGELRDGTEIRCARDQVFSPIHVDDVVASVDAVIRLGLNGVFNVSNPQAFSRLEMVQALDDCMGNPGNLTECSIRDFKFLDNRPLDLSMKPDKILSATGLTFKDVHSCCEDLSARV